MRKSSYGHGGARIEVECWATAPGKSRWGVKMDKEASRSWVSVGITVQKIKAKRQQQRAYLVRCGKRTTQEVCSKASKLILMIRLCVGKR